jgi:hypothetical protein
VPQEHSQLRLDVFVRDAVLDISIINHSTEPTRVWDLTNSWGWETLSLEIKRSPLSADSYTLTVKPMAFTRNGPGFTEIPRGGISHIAILAGNPEWNGIEHIEHFRSETLWVRAYLRIPPSPEADTYRLFVGEVGSPLAESHPPHRWLWSRF